MATQRVLKKVLDGMYGYYHCVCGHDAVDHYMDFPSKRCSKCKCSRFDLAKEKEELRK